ncbi:MAG TPA: M14 family metallocarboxypeptidase [Verrucomicrobiae bacterium]|nr:M14 family metallocarboxypeptidase [Verrucomicrobiae bacterium]
MQKLGKNSGGYFGETIDIRAVLREVDIAAGLHGWTSETFHNLGGFPLLALHRLSTFNSQSSTKIYISTGIHGDEPAGPLAALKLIQENRWPDNAEIFLLPCLNPVGFTLNRRENADGKDLNRDYRNTESNEVAAHIRWLQQQPDFNVTFCLHEDWESHGFYLYELNPEQRPSFARAMLEAVSRVCPIDLSPMIEGREANAGLINPSLDPATRPLWPESFWLLQNKTRQSYTLEAPSDFPLKTRIRALAAGVSTAIQRLVSV